MKNRILMAIIGAVLTAVSASPAKADIGFPVSTTGELTKDINTEIKDIKEVKIHEDENDPCSVEIVETGTVAVKPPLDLSPYQDILETRSDTVIEITNTIGPAYNVDPHLIQAMVFYESSNNPHMVGLDNDTGYMQIINRWHYDRMERLGCTDLYDGWQNILVGTDFISELLQKYGDVSLSLMKYNGDSRAEYLYSIGERSDYADRIIRLYEKLTELDNLIENY